MAVSPAQVEKYLSGVDYPVSKDVLIRHAEEEGADQETCQTLEQLPFDEFSSPTEVSEALGSMN